LFLPGSQAFRLPIRFSAFAISLVAFGWYLLAAPPLPRTRMQPWVVALLTLLGLMVLHPQTVTLTAGIGAGRGIPRGHRAALLGAALCQIARTDGAAVLDPAALFRR
jgi:hypothetical protein